ncbi:MAG TPA: CPBP family intramembrane glutamic endopeptidase [Longimicrobiales bacterium]
MRSGATGWIGAVARIAAYAGLLVALGIVLGTLWRMLPDAVHEVAFLESVVTAAAALLAGALLIRGIDGRPVAALGIALTPAALRHAGIGVMIGVAGLLTAVAALLLSGSLAYAGQQGTGGAWIAAVAAQAGIFTAAALAEEAVFRGYGFQVLARAGGPVAATVVSAVLFALAHGANPSVGVFALVNIFLAGILLAIAYLRTLSLWFATAVHMGWNWAMATLFDLPVSGLEMFDTPLYEPVVGGPEWWSGARFGPEGGLVGTIGFTVALLVIIRWRGVQPDPAIAAARPLMLRSEEESNAG